MGNTQYAFDMLDGVVDLINEMGHEATLNKVESGDWKDPQKPSLGREKTVTAHTVSLLFVDFKKDEIDGTLVQSGDQLAVISMKDIGFEIELEDVIVDNGTEWAIVSITAPEIAGIPVVTFAQVRK